MNAFLPSRKLDDPKQLKSPLTFKEVFDAEMELNANIENLPNPLLLVI